MIARKEHVMDSMEYSNLLSKLDHQLEVAKEEAEVRAQREEMEQRVKLLDHWIGGLEKKKAELAQYNVEPEIDIASHIAEMQAEKTAILARLEGKIEREQLSPEHYQEMKDLLDEIENGFLPTDPELCWWTFEMWAIRWRMAADTLSEESRSTNGFMKKIYAKIREQMKLQPSMWYIKALGKGESYADWRLRLEECWAAFKKRQEEVDRQEAEKNAADDAIVAVTQAFIAHRDCADAESERKLRHHIRDAAKYPHLRDEIALVVTPFREALQEEFGFLWTDGNEKEEEEAPAKKKTNREILSKMLSRMKSKSLIGASHGPYEQIYKGFAAHDAGRAKEGLDVLIHAGVVKAKDSVIGQRVSIHATMIPKVESFMNGAPMGIEEVDGWAQN